MEFSTKGFDRAAGRALLTSVLIPRPVVWITTLAPQERFQFNIAPFSSIAPVCNQPPLLSFCCHRRSDGTRKRTALNIRESGEFVVNTMVPSFLENVCASAELSRMTLDKFGYSGVTPAPCLVVKAPRVAEALTSLECVLLRCVEVGEGGAETDLFIGRIVHVHSSNDGRVNNREGQTDVLGALELDYYLVQAKKVFRPDMQSSSTKSGG